MRKRADLEMTKTKNKTSKTDKQQIGGMRMELEETRTWFLPRFFHRPGPWS